MGYELFDKMTRSFTAKISIRRNGQIGFSKGAVNKFGLQGQRFCKLYYDSDRCLVGFEFTNDERPNVTAKVVEREQDMFILGKPFLSYYNIDFRVTRVYMAEKDEESSLLFIDLNKPSYESKRAEKKK